MCYCRHFFSSFFHSFLCFTHEKKVVECARTHTNNGMHRRNRISSWIFFSFLFRRQSDRRAHKEQFAFSLFRCIVAHAKKKTKHEYYLKCVFFLRLLFIFFFFSFISIFCKLLFPFHLLIFFSLRFQTYFVALPFSYFPFFQTHCQ